MSKEWVAGIVLALLGLGVSAGQGFEITGWVLIFWGLAVVVGIVAFLHKEPSPPSGFGLLSGSSSPNGEVLPADPLRTVAKRLNDLEFEGVRSLLPANIGSPPWEHPDTFPRTAELWRRNLVVVLRDAGVPTATISNLEILPVEKNLIVEGLRCIEEARKLNAPTNIHQQVAQALESDEQSLSIKLQARKRSQSISDMLRHHHAKGIALFHERVRTAADYQVWKERFREFERALESAMSKEGCSESEIHGIKHIGPVPDVHSPGDGAYRKADHNKGRLVHMLDYIGRLADQHDTTKPT